MRPSFIRSFITLFIAFAGFAILLGNLACNPPEPQQGGRIEQTPKFENNRTLSPIIVVPPVLTCGKSVTVKGFIPGAIVRIYSDGARIGEKIGIDPEGQTIPVSPDLIGGRMITATQEFESVESGPSTAERVKDHTEVYPLGLPKPDFPFLYLYKCGIATFVNNLPPGGDVRVFTRPPAPGSTRSLIGSGSGVAEGNSIGIGPPFVETNKVWAESQICTVTSDPSDEHDVKPAPGTLPKPEVTGIYDNGTLITIHQLVNGAAVTIKRGGVTLGGGGAPSSHVRFGLNAAVHAGESIEIVQELCGVFSPPEVEVVQPCSALPPARMLAPRAGDVIVYFMDVEPGSRIQIFSGTTEIGDGGGSAIALYRPLIDGETIRAVQSMGTCVAQTSHVLEVGHGLEDPVRPGACGRTVQFEYGALNDPARQTTDVSSYFNMPSSAVTVPMTAVPLHGVVRYPEGPGPFPLVLIVHGNHSPTEASYPGYNYLLDHFASHCMIAVSVEEDFLNGRVDGEMDARAIVLLRHLQLWREWNRTPGHRFYGKVDMSRIGLSGHSRGGEAIVAAKLLNQTLHNAADPAHNFNFGIRSLYAIAPVDGQFDNGPITLNGADYYVMHGTHDGDVAEFDGHRMYDRAFPVTGSTSNFKGLLWVYGGNHAQWNSVWSPSGDPSPITPTGQLISEANQMLIGKSYMTSFFLAGLKGWNSYLYFLNGEVTFTSLPSGVTRVFQYQDPNRVFINHYEEDDDLATGSFAGVTNVRQGSFSIYNDIDLSDRGAPHFLWQQSDGFIAGWNSSENALVRMQIPAALAAMTSNYEFLSFRVTQTHEATPSLNTPGTNKDMTVQMIMGGVNGPDTKVSDFVPLPYPMVTSQTAWSTGGPKSIMQTVRMPLSTLIGKEGNVARISEIIFKFNRHTSGILAIDEVQFTK